VSSENWHEERDRLVRLLYAIENGEVTHVDEDGHRQLQATNEDNVGLLEQRLVRLNLLLGGG